MTKTTAKSIVFITGAFLGNNCWNEWKLFFERKGYSCIAPAWPHKDASPEELRNRNSYDAIAQTRLADLTDYFASIVHELPAKPIMIGHSIGGLIVQLLLQRGLGTAGVALHSFPPQGISTIKFSLLKAWWEAMGFFTPVKKTYLMSFKKWKNNITNGMPCDQQKEFYYRYAVPESKLLVRDAFTSMAKINFNNAHSPLLFISGGRDQIIPASLNYNNYRKYKMDDSMTDYKEFKNRNHLVFGQPAWVEDADFILYWIEGLK